MLAITPQMRIPVAVEAVDFRKYAPSMDISLTPVYDLAILRNEGRRHNRSGQFEIHRGR